MFLAIINIIFCFAVNTDPAADQLQYRTVPLGQFTQNQSLPPSLITPPNLNLSLSDSMDNIIVTINPDQTLYAGWTDTNFCSAFPAWNYWWLNTRLGIDRLDSIYVLISLYNYSNNDSDFQRIVLDNCGNWIREDLQWNGYQGQPIVRDGFGDNHYIGHPVLGWLDNMDAGVIDFLNQISTTMTDSLHNVRFTKLDSLGNVIINQVPVATGDTGQSWTGDTHLAFNSLGIYYAAWSRNMHEIVYSISTDEGLTWQNPEIVAMDFVNQVNKPEILIGPDNCVHFIWQHWDGSHNYLIYKKLNAQNICLVDTSNLTPDALVEVWAPEMAIDQDTNLHIIWSSSYQGSDNLYHTIINGRYDNNGFPAADSEITIVQEYPFYGNSLLKRYPKIIIDSLDCRQVIFDQGAYGLNTDKHVYHIKQTLQPRGYVIYPDSSKHNFVMHGNCEVIDAPMPGIYFVKVWAWNSNGETGWDTASVEVTALLENSNCLPAEFKVLPTVTRDIVHIFCNYHTMPSAEITLFDITGRQQNKYRLKKHNNKYSLSIRDRPAGIYYLQIRYDDRSPMHRIIHIR